MIQEARGRGPETTLPGNTGVAGAWTTLQSVGTGKDDVSGVSRYSSVLPKWSLFAERYNVDILLGQNLQICLILLGLSNLDLRIWNLYRSIMEMEMATHFSILAWTLHGQRSLVGYSLWDHKDAIEHPRAHAHDLILTSFTLSRPSLQIRSHSEVLGGKGFSI